MPSESEEMLANVIALAQEISLPRLAAVYAHSGEEFVETLLAHSYNASFTRTSNGDGRVGQYMYFNGVPIYTQAFLLPGTALMINQYGTIMKVVRYGDLAASADPKVSPDDSEDGAIGGGLREHL